jgi:flagellar basal body rod protein FlgG
MDGIGWTVSAMRAARARLEIAAYNVANASSEGFRKAIASVALTAQGLVVRHAPSSEPLVGGRSNVNTIGEMVDVLDAQRSFETAQKALASIDETRAKAANEVARLR